MNNACSTYTPINKGQFTLEPPDREADFERKRGFGVEAAYRENRRQWTDYPRQQYVAEYPLHVDIELSSACNLRCPMCYTITEAFKSKVHATLMDYGLFTKLVDECACGGVYSIRLSLRGESFLHSRIVDCIRYAKHAGIKEVSTLTNGVKLDEVLFEEVMHAGLDWITISFDGLGETYERIRHPAKYKRALEKVRCYHEIKKAAGRVKPLVKVQSILPAVKDNLAEYYRTFASIADMVSVNPLIDYLHKDSRPAIQHCRDFCCPQLFQRLVIGADGLVMLCANDEDGSEIVGDANNEKIGEIWHCRRIEEARAVHKRHEGIRRYAVCAKCYLPRRTEPMVLNLDGRSICVEHYTNRTQTIGE